MRRQQQAPETQLGDKSIFARVVKCSMPSNVRNGSAKEYREGEGLEEGGVKFKRQSSQHDGAGAVPPLLPYTASQVRELSTVLPE